jgi:hypothetical protein
VQMRTCTSSESSLRRRMDLQAASYCALGLALFVVQRGESKVPVFCILSKAFGRLAEVGQAEAVQLIRASL